MQKMWNYILDILFPPRKEDILLRTMSLSDIQKMISKVPQPEYDFIHALLPYKNPLVRELVWQIKYKKNPHALTLAGECFVQYIEKTYREPVTIIPVPLSSQRFRERGYNQCECIADEMVRISPQLTISTDTVRRTEHRERQTKKGRDERIHNVENLFSVHNNLPHNTHLIVIDDVTTTGSTLKEIRDVLAKAGYSRVDAISLAH